MDARRLPVCPALGDGEWLLYVNYFGIASDDLLAEVKRRWPRVIFDNTQAFFSAPRMDADSYNVYSCRKFVGVPDGAYLVHTGLTDGIYPADTSWQHAAFLFRCIDESVNSAYGDSLDNESRFDGEIRGMSPSTRRILASVEYDALRLRRRANYEALHAALAPHNALDCPAGADAMIYPFLCRVDGLRGRLIKIKSTSASGGSTCWSCCPPTPSRPTTAGTCCRCPSTSATRPTICAHWRRWCCS